jgi:hypothetical protein
VLGTDDERGRYSEEEIYYIYVLEINGLSKLTVSDVLAASMMEAASVSETSVNSYQNTAQNPRRQSS